MSAAVFGKASRASKEFSGSTATPGPGAYTTAANTKAYVPKWSMSKAPKTKPITSISPGPGAYELKPKKSGPTYVIPGRNIRKKVDYVPGPGQYNADNDHKQPTMVKMNSHNPRPLTSSGSGFSTVGPGSYDLRDPKQSTGGKFSRDTRKDFLRKGSAQNPGPGAYQLSTERVKHSSPAFSLGSKTSGVRLSAGPGPGSYEVPERAIRATSPSWVVGKSQRKVFSASTDSVERGFPGPGSYTLASSVGSGPKYAIRPKTAYIKLSEAPGPGQYSWDSARGPAKGTSVVIGKAQRGNDLTGGKKEVPGPGAYTQSSSFDARQGHTFGGSRPMDKRDAAPGPGSYEIQY